MSKNLGYKLRDWSAMNADQKLNVIRSSVSQELSTNDIEYAQRNLKIFCKFVEESFNLRRKRTHGSAQSIIEVIRHNSILSDDSEDFKISHRCRAIFSRLAMRIFVDLEGFFTTRIRL